MLTGNAGNDTLDGGEGTDTLDGGADTDTADYSSRSTAVNVTLDGVDNDGIPRQTRASARTTTWSTSRT